MHMCEGNGHEEEQARKEWPSLKVHGSGSRFSGREVQKKASIVRCSTNSTQSSMIYKLRSGLAGWPRFDRPSTVFGSRVLELAG
jgi:hypothetical protein